MTIKSYMVEPLHRDHGSLSLSLALGKDRWLTFCSCRIQPPFQIVETARETCEDKDMLTVCAEIITELILMKSTGPSFHDFFTGMNYSFQTDSGNLSCKKSNTCKSLETKIVSRQGLSHNKISKFSEVNSRKRFSGSAINCLHESGPRSSR